MNQEFYENYYETHGFYVDLDVLHLGGPELCQDSFPSNFTFGENSSPKVNITLCGVPNPEVEGKFIDQKLAVSYGMVNKYTHNYKLQLPLLTQMACGEELAITATAKGRNDTLNIRTKIFLEKCK